MGENIKCSQCMSTFNKMFLLGKQGNTDICPVCGGKLVDDVNDSAGEDKKDWITWYYYGFKPDGKTTFLTEVEENLDECGDEYFLIKEFQGPPRDKDGKSNAAKEILRQYIPDAFSPAKEIEPIIRCPRCGSKEFTLLNKGYSLFSGFLGSGRIKRVCNYCKKEF